MWLTRGVATVNVSDYLRETAQRDPEGIALVDEATGRTLTWREFDESADRGAQALLGQGLVAGHRVALVMANSINFCLAYYAVLRGGMVAVPINPRATTREIGRVIADCAPRAILAADDAIDHVRAADSAGVLVVVNEAAPRAGEVAFVDLLEAAPDLRPMAPPDAESLAVVLYTSGASGLPRGAMLSHRALIANIEQVGRLEPPLLTGDDVVLGLLPLFHVYGLNCVLGQSVRVGATLVLVNSFDPAGSLEVIRRHQITNVPVAPPVIAAWAGRAGLREAFASVRVVLSGAAALDPELEAEFFGSSGHRVEQGYGLTEASPVISSTVGFERDPDRPLPPGSVGRPLPGIEVELRDALGQVVMSDDPAQIFVRGDNLFSGYWPDGVDGPAADGWYGTGDLGIQDADGNLVLVDRLRELIIVSGFNVYPTEVEEVVAETPGVAQVAVVGVPDERTGEAVVAFVVPDDPGAQGDDELAALVIEYTRERLARFKVPAKVVVAAGLPQSATGKIAKGRLRALARSEELGIAGTP